MEKERRHFAHCRGEIKRNIERLETQLTKVSAESEELYHAVRGGETELYSQLIVSLDIKEGCGRSLHKNRQAYEKPYFGRIDYEELATGKKERLYIGKNGIMLEDHRMLIVDWRAPVAAVYYENELGEGSYRTVGGGSIPVDLELKRTFDIGEGRLLGFYDSDVAANDELLVKYLSQNKEAVLGDIIATIQKEQNEIIRETPYANLIVQGVAGSGKTTVAMHRISYILYNYREKFAGEDFCIIAGSDMLLRYITSSLPELDVDNVKQLRMERFFMSLLDREWKKNYRYMRTEAEEAFKSKVEFIQRLDVYLQGIRERVLPFEDVGDPEAGVFMSGESIREIVERNKERSVAAMAAALNERLIGRIKMLLSEEEKELKARKLKQYKNWFVWKKGQKPVDIYLSFLVFYSESHREALWIENTLEHVQKGRFDIYDLAALTLIYVRVLAKEKLTDYRQIIVDEAQDFGASVYYALRQALPDCYFTIMGDVSQNINFDTGMNSWSDLELGVFEKKTRFHVLAKSYRNTIEISEYAGRALRMASAGIYKIQPVIRHGKPVQLWPIKEQTGQEDKARRRMADKAAELIEDIRKSGYETVAVICRDEAQAIETARLLDIPTQGEMKADFQKGVMVLAVERTKGLEFDAVILWEPNASNYRLAEGDSKLLYVAVTRALHELHLIYSGELSKLL